MLATPQALTMAAGVAMPEVTIAKPSIGLVSETESKTSIRPEDKVGCLSCVVLFRNRRRSAVEPVMLQRALLVQYWCHALV